MVTFRPLARKIRPLTREDFDTILSAFNEAFSDYVVPMKLTREQLEAMFTRRGWSPELSAGVFDDERLVAFTANGFHGHTAYDSGTGVVPSHRRRGLAKQMMEFLVPHLRAGGAKRYVLEVIESNTPAATLYRESGFTVTRRLQCWSFAGEGAPGSDGTNRTDGTYGVPTEAWFEVAPSWQNATHSVARSRDPHVVLGNADGFAILFPSNGDVPQLAVRPEARRRGLGTRLLREAAAIAGKPLRIMNVDDRHEGIARFLEAAGAMRTVAQLEMELPL
ncbi:MAG TPA: GNAT family N-acetyltransferase [Thermoanaerobaculia bacterium]|jgi:ribosomal protein S18 acetylase RimI-like enzyme